MKWSVTQSTDSVHVRILIPLGYSRSGPTRSVLGLHPGRVGQDILVGENPMMAQIFINQFVRAHGNYLTTDFRAQGWVHPAQKPWWRDLALYILEHFDAYLKRLRLHEAVRVTYGLEISVPNFFSIFEL